MLYPMQYRTIRAARLFACTLALAAVVPLGGVACGQTAAESARSYEVDGTVRRIDREGRSITIAHENVPGYMPAMTMPFTVEDAHLFADLAEGDRVRFRFVAAGGGRHVIETIRKL